MTHSIRHVISVYSMTGRSAFSPDMNDRSAPSSENVIPVEPDDAVSLRGMLLEIPV